MKGYYKQPEATAKVIDSEEWYHTGDMGYYDENNQLYLHGRIKNTSFSVNGEVLPFWQVERALMLISDVVEASCVMQADKNSGTLKIIAFVVLLKGSLITKHELMETAKNCGNIELPIEVKIVDSLPLTKNGKFKVRELLKQVTEEKSHINNY